jgi:hypothetical protein
VFVLLPTYKTIWCHNPKHHRMNNFYGFVIPCLYSCLCCFLHCEFLQ